MDHFRDGKILILEECDDFLPRRRDTTRAKRDLIQLVTNVMYLIFTSSDSTSPPGGESVRSLSAEAALLGVPLSKLKACVGYAPLASVNFTVKAQDPDLRILRYLRNSLLKIRLITAHLLAHDRSS